MPGTLFLSTQDGHVWALKSSGGAAARVVLWDWGSAWLMAPAASGKVFALPTPLP